MQKTTLVGIAGPNGAGKSRVTKLIQKELTDVERIKLDNYFYREIDRFLNKI